MGYETAEHVPKNYLETTDKLIKPRSKSWNVLQKWKLKVLDDYCNIYITSMFMSIADKAFYA